jgi:hypothetical protein
VLEFDGVMQELDRIAERWYGKNSKKNGEVLERRDRGRPGH